MAEVVKNVFQRCLYRGLLRLALPSGIGAAVVLKRQFISGHEAVASGRGWAQWTAPYVYESGSEPKTSCSMPYPLPLEFLLGSLERMDEGFNALKDTFGNSGEKGSGFHQSFLSGIRDERNFRQNAGH